MYQKDQDRIFKMVADEYLAEKEGQWTVKSAKHNRQLLHDHLYPAIGHRILLSLSETDYQAILDRLCDNGMYETARKLRTRIHHVIAFAVEKGYASPSDLPFSPQRPPRA